MTALLGTSFGVFIGLTVIITGGAAIMTGRALADGWKSPAQVVLACVLSRLSPTASWFTPCSAASCSASPASWSTSW